MINTQVESRGKGTKILQSRDGAGVRGMKPASGSTTQEKTRGKKASNAGGVGAMESSHPAAVTNGNSGKAASHDEIAALAHQIYLKKGCPQGRDLENWLEAEEQLRAAR